MNLKCDFNSSGGKISCTSCVVTMTEEAHKAGGADAILKCDFLMCLAMCTENIKIFNC